jgi:hypothetical protein
MSSKIAEGGYVRLYMGAWLHPTHFLQRVVIPFSSFCGRERVQSRIFFSKKKFSTVQVRGLGSRGMDARGTLNYIA